MLAYYGVIKLIGIWTGCSSNEAVTRLQRFVNGIPNYRFGEDSGLQNEIWENVKKVIGDKRYQQLVALSTTAISTPLFLQVLRESFRLLRCLCIIKMIMKFK